MTATTIAPAVTESPDGRVKKIRILMNGVTGRMGMNQHLIRSILAIRDGGGLEIAPGQVIMPEPVLIGRSEVKLAALAERFGVEEYTTDLAGALASGKADVYFDAQLTAARVPAVEAAIDAGLHVYCEKPLAPTVDEAMSIARRAQAVGVKQGIVQDKLFLPGMVKLRRLVEQGFFGEILSVRGEFGYWVFPGPSPAAQRPSWNYVKANGGGIISDMFPHWQYVIDSIVGAPTAVVANGATHIPVRADESGAAYDADAEDAVYATFETESGAIVQLNSSWCVRVDRGELFELQVDGTSGSAVAGLLNCKVQPGSATPKSVWNPDLADPIDHRAGWIDVPDVENYTNGFRAQWELFLRHVVLDEPFPWDFLSGAKGIQLAEVGEQSWTERRWVDVSELSL